VGTAAASAGIASASVLQKLGWTKLLALSAVGAAVLVPVGLVAWKGREAPARKPAPSVVRQAPAAAAPAQVSPPVPRATHEPASAPPVEERSPKADVRAAPSNSGALAAELGLLDVARSKLGAGDARGALAALDEHSRTFPRGRLGLEAEVLRIDALSRAGETATAKKRAEAFLKRHPKSVLAPRVSRYLGDTK
jgi:hypothetical protein